MTVDQAAANMLGVALIGAALAVMFGAIIAVIMLTMLWIGRDR